MKLTPLGDRVVLKQLVAEETTKSGIVLPGRQGSKDGSESRRSGYFLQIFGDGSKAG